jgi:hemerythrin
MNPEYIVGIKEIDDQHEEIDSLTETLCEAIKNKESGAQLHPLLVRFYALLESHFKVEETIMRTLSYPAADKHISAHQHILDKIDALKQAAAQGDTVELDEIEARQILIFHVFEHDQPFAAFVRTKHIL